MGIFWLIPLLLSAVEPTLSCDQAHVQLGTLQAGQLRSHTFEIVNRSTEQLQLGQPRTSCGCSKVKLDAILLRPGESTKLQVQLNTLALAEGPYTWQIQLPFHPLQVPENVQAIHLQIQAKIQREWTLQPVALSVVLQSGSEEKLLLRDRRQKPLTITNIQCTHRKMQVKVDTKDPREQHIQLKIPEELPTGTYQEEIVLRTDDAKYPEIRIPVQVIKRNPLALQVSPEELTLRLAKGQTGKSGLIQIRGPEGAPIEIAKIEADHPEVTHRYAIGMDGLITLKLGIQLTEHTKSGTAQVRITFAKPMGQIVVIPLRWQLPEVE